jgi:hypothetical protein
MTNDSSSNDSTLTFTTALTVSGMITVVLLIAYLFSGCTTFQAKKNTQTAIDATLAACVLAHQFFPEAEVMAVCDVADDLLPVVRRLIAASKTGMAGHVTPVAP